MCCAIAAFTFTGLSPAVAAFGDSITYEAVDAVEVLADQIRVMGIISGQGAPSTTLYTIVNTGSTDVAASRCDRLALLAMSKPGKFQFAVVEELSTPVRFGCKLIVRTP
jgi:hypothetical protein